MTDVPFLDLHAAYSECADEFDASYRRVMDSGWYILSGEVSAFEEEWAEYCGVSECIGMGNGLNALELVLRAWNVGPGDEVIVPSNTYIASWLAVTAVGATIVPVEPDPATSNLDPARIQAALTDRTRVIMPVHLYGQVVEMDPLLELAADRGIRVLEDAAQAHGAEYRGRRAGALGDAAAWSFYPTKNLGAFGDGGAVTTDDKELAAQLRLLRNYGSARKYYNEIIGTNSRLDPIQAAFLRVQLRHLDERNQRRGDKAQRYLEELAGLPGLRLPEVPDWATPVWHVFAIHHERRDELQDRLTAAGVQTLIFYPVPPHKSDAYAADGWSGREYPLAEELARTTLGLPIGPHMTAQHQDTVIAAVREATMALSRGRAA
jgi:dTDP-4-amino-4,6-dideoxygalactose transaminase